MIAQAIKASGAIVRVEPRDFEAILQKVESPLVIHAEAWFFGVKQQYLTSYKGLTFFTKTQIPLTLRAGTELVEAKKIWIPA